MKHLIFLASAYSMLVDGPRLIFYVNEPAGHAWSHGGKEMN